MSLEDEAETLDLRPTLPTSPGDIPEWSFDDLIRELVELEITLHITPPNMIRDEWVASIPINSNQIIMCKSLDPREAVQMVLNRSRNSKAITKPEQT